MKKNHNSILKNKKLIILTVIILIILIGIKFIINSKYNASNAPINDMNQIEKANIDKSNERETRNTNDNGNKMENLTNSKEYNCIAVVNNENINEKEKEFVNFQLNNESVNKDGEHKDAIEELVEQYIILQDAEANEIRLSKSENERIANNVKASLEKDVKETNEILEKFNMDYNEFLEFYTEREKKRQLILNWNSNINHKINNGELEIESEEFKNKYNEYKNSDNISIKYKLLTEMKKIYINYLKDKAIIEYK